jgi:hypothetical protein
MLTALAATGVAQELLFTSGRMTVPDQSITPAVRA